MEARPFGKVLRNFVYAEQRFNSRTEPLFKLFHLLPAAVDALIELGGVGLKFVGTLQRGYDLIVSAALVADIMMLIQPCIRLEDSNDGDAALLGSTASKIRDDLRNMLELGSIWLKESEGTCVHAALQAMQGRVVFFRDASGKKTCAAIGWPAPTDLALKAPLNRAKDMYKLYMAFFDTTFPMWDIQNGFAAFDLGAKFTLPERKVFLDSLAIRIVVVAHAPILYRAPIIMYGARARLLRTVRMRAMRVCADYVRCACAHVRRCEALRVWASVHGRSHQQGQAWCAVHVAAGTGAEVQQKYRDYNQCTGDPQQLGRRGCVARLLRARRRHGCAGKGQVARERRWDCCALRW